MATLKEWLSSQWVLHDSDHRHFESGNDLFRDPDGSSTDDVTDAQLFPSADDASVVSHK